jgi:hypothetical protein
MGQRLDCGPLLYGAMGIELATVARTREATPFFALYQATQMGAHGVYRVQAHIIVPNVRLDLRGIGHRAPRKVRWFPYRNDLWCLAFRFERKESHGLPDQQNASR